MFYRGFIKVLSRLIGVYRGFIVAFSRLIGVYRGFIEAYRYSFPHFPFLPHNCGRVSLGYWCPVLAIS